MDNLTSACAVRAHSSCATVRGLILECGYLEQVVALFGAQIWLADLQFRAIQFYYCVVVVWVRFSASIYTIQIINIVNEPRARRDAGVVLCELQRSVGGGF